jgi:nucleoside-diphosphate-sugar epimerase
VRAASRNPERAAVLFGRADGLECVPADTRDAASLAAAVDGVAAVACCTGTTAFPSRRWFGGNGPKATDEEGVKNLVAAARRAPTPPARFILVSSAGVDRADRPPYSILNAFGVLTAKRAGEDALKGSGLPWTLLRPGRLTDGPYTSYDLNTLLQATADDRRGVVASPRDDLDGQTSRIAVAEAVVQCLSLDCTEGAALSLESAPGEGPGMDAAKWEALLCGAVGRK